MILQVFPYLVVTVGLENILVLTKSVVSTPPHLDSKIRVAQGLSREGWSITKNLLTELTILTVGLFTLVPSIQVNYYLNYTLSSFRITFPIFTFRNNFSGILYICNGWTLVWLLSPDVFLFDGIISGYEVYWGWSRWITYFQKEILYSGAVFTLPF